MVAYIKIIRYLVSTDYNWFLSISFVMNINVKNKNTNINYKIVLFFQLHGATFLSCNLSSISAAI